MIKVLKNLSEFQIVCLLVSLGILCRLPSYFVPFYNIDELTNGLFSIFLIQGDLGSEFYLGNTYALMHYLHTQVASIFGLYNLTALHVVHSLWVGGTTAVLYFAGKELAGSKKAGVSAAIFYALFSTMGFSKDFQAAISESFSLLPMSLSFLYFFRSLSSKKRKHYYFVGFFIGIAALFKAPAGILILASSLVYLFASRKFLEAIVFSILALFLALAIPLFIYGNPIEGAQLMINKITLVQESYVKAYEELSFIYWFSKYVFRTFLVVAFTFPLWYFASSAIKEGLFKRSHIKRREFTSLFYLVLSLVFLWMVVALGKRVFFHYYVFLFPPLCLLASFSFSKLSDNLEGFVKTLFTKKRHLALSVLTLASFFTFMSDAILRWSGKHHDFSKVIDKVQSLSHKSESIYVWGLVPQLYYFSERKPASTMIWADTLAGLSTGTKAMEYMRSTGQTLNLVESFSKDLESANQDGRTIQPVKSNKLHLIRENELLSFHEVLTRIENPHWKKLFQDFIKSPPRLILDTSPSNIRHFSYYPIERYELLSKFIKDNYNYLSQVDQIDIYRLKK